MISKKLLFINMVILTIILVFVLLARWFFFSPPSSGCLNYVEATFADNVSTTEKQALINKYKLNLDEYNSKLEDELLILYATEESNLTAKGLAEKMKSEKGVIQVEPKGYCL